MPIAVAGGRKEALLALGAKRSEEPYSRDDQELLVAIAASLAFLLEKPPAFPARREEPFEECPACGACYDTGTGTCPREGAALVLAPLPRLLAGRYRLERRVGRGGMGTVYEAIDTALGRRVAAKLIREDGLERAEATERFRREARAAAAFAHPNVVTVHDFGVAGGRPFLVMELLEGRSLRDELRLATRLAPSRTVEILCGVCAAVEAAHRRELVHRDLKPENIFLARGETGEVVKVLDFGVAKLLAPGSVSSAETATGALVGTLRYMSPEQLRGGAVQPSWDLWALAVVAYEMLTGSLPFPGRTVADWQEAVLAARFNPVAAHRPDAPAPWQRFFERAFALEVGRRPASASGFLSELTRALA